MMGHKALSYSRNTTLEAGNLVLCADVYDWNISPYRTHMCAYACMKNRVYR